MYHFLIKLKSGMTYVLARLCTILLVVMTLLVLWQVFTRYCLNNPASFTEELVRYFLIWTGFIGAAYAFVSREHMALTFVRDRFDDKTRRMITIMVDAIILVFAFSILVVGGTKLALSATMEYSALLGVPRSLVYSMAPISGVFIIIAQFINLYEDFTGVELNTQAAPATPAVTVAENTATTAVATESAAGTADTADTAAAAYTSAEAHAAANNTATANNAAAAVTQKEEP